MNIVKNKTRILVFAALIMVAYGLFINVGKPFIGMHDWNGAFYGILVRNYYKLGLIHAKFGQVTGYDVSTGRIGYFIHYTPFLPLLFYFSTKIFGFFESSFRFVTVFFSLLFVVYIYRIGSLIKLKIGLIAALVISLTPMFLYYGKLPDHDPVVVSLSTIAVFYFLKDCDLQNKKSFMKFILVWFFALIESWPAFFLTPGFFIVGIFSRKFKKSKLVFISVFPLIIFLLFIFYSYTLNGSLTDLANVFKFRTNIAENAAYSFTIKTYISTLAHFFVIYYSAILLFLSMIGALFLYINMNAKKKVLAKNIFLILFIYGAGYPVLFRNLSWIHDYKIIHFMPLVAILSGSGIYFLMQKARFLCKTKMIMLIFLPLCFFVFNERKAYLVTIINTGHAKEAHRIGIYLKSKLATNQKALIFPKIFGTNHSTFVEFYSEGKRIYYSNDLNTKSNGAYDYLILTSDFNNENNRKLFLRKYNLIFNKNYAVFKNNNSH